MTTMVMSMTMDYNISTRQPCHSYRHLASCTTVLRQTRGYSQLPQSIVALFT